MKRKLLISIICLFPVMAGAASIMPLVPGLNSDDPDERQAARNAILKVCSDATAPGTPIAELAELEQEIIDLLEVDLLLEERLYLIRLLELYGTGRSVDALSSLLGDKEVEIGDSARRALASIPGQSARNALLGGLVSKDSDKVISTLDALAYRGDSSVAPNIIDLLEWKDLEVVKAAAQTLGKLKNEDVVLDMKIASRKAKGEVAVLIETALVDAGLDKTDAYTFARKGQSGAVRAGAFLQLIDLNPSRAEKVVREAKASKKFDGRVRIIDTAMNHGTGKMRDYLVSTLDRSSVEDQIVIVGAIGDAGLSAYESDLLELLESAEGELRIEILDTLGDVGGDASFDVLYAAYVDDSKNKVIAEAISRLNAPAADAKALQAASAGSDMNARLASLNILAERNGPGATQLCNEIAANPGDKKLREAAFKALENIGNLESVKVLTQLILDKDSSMRAAQLSLKRLALNYDAPDALWDDVFRPTLEKASDDQQEGLIMVLDGNPGKDTLDYLRYLILFKEGGLRQAAMRTLPRWPNADSGYVWLEVVSSDGVTDADIATAQRAILRILSTDDVEGSANKKGDLAVTVVNSNLPEAFKVDAVEALDRKHNTWQLGDLQKKLKPLADDPVVGEAVNRILEM
ncbi:MAG: HEAT repeat domain-containing protein [Puniceicoccaceae bacterium]